MGGHVTVELACAVEWNVPGREARHCPMITSCRPVLHQRSSAVIMTRIRWNPLVPSAYYIHASLA